MAGIKDYSTTNLNNTSLNGISVAEGMLPSNLNNAIRALMVNTREWFNDSQWVEYGDGDGAYTAAYASGTSFTINGVNVTSIYHTGRRIKLIASTPGTIFGTISSSSFSSNTTVNVTWDSGSLSNEAITRVYVGALSQTNNSIPTDVIDSSNLKSNSVTTAKINNDAINNDKIADNAVQAAQINASAVTEAKINAGAVTNTKLGADSVNGSKIADDSIDSEHIADGSIDTAHIGDNQVTLAKIADATIVTNSEQASHTPDDNTFYTTLSADTRFLNKDTSELINSGNTWSASDDKIATTAAIDARVIDLVDDVGGFVAIANETSFPNTNPDINDGAGTIVSVKALASSHTANGSGQITIANGTLNNSTVTLTGLGASETIAAGFGILVESTTTNHTYAFHRLVPKATEVTTVASKSVEIGRLGTADAVSDMNTLGTTQTVSDMNTLAAISGLDSLASNSANVTTVANNLSSVNNFAEVYRIASSAPTTSLNVGDLYFDTTANELKVYKSSGWAAAGSTVNGTSARFKYTASGGQTTFTGSDDNGNTLAYDAGFIDCYLNGVKLINGTDITVTSGTSVVLAAGATAGDILDLVGFGTFNVASIAASSITSGTMADARLPTTMASKTLTGATVTTNYNGLTVSGDGGSNDGQIQLNCSQNSHGVKIKAPPHSAGQSYTLTLPSSITNNYFLKTDGSGNLSFAEVPGETKPTVADVSQTIAPATATTITITGTNFVSIPQVDFVKTDGSVTTANSVSFSSATSLSVNVTLALGNYYVRIENPDGNSGRSTNNIITASTAPSFSTAAGSLGTIAGNFSGTVATVAGSSDSSITFSEVTNVLTNASQANCSLNSTTGVITTTDFGGSSTTPTTYNFTLRITDAEAQTVDRAFSLTSSFGATGGGQFN
tara:strand:- start:9 stop:2714 length:2706 start_codon:yes stop_codon:yes gene_type:complete